MVVEYPFTIRQDTLMTKELQDGTIQAVASELRLFISVEENEVPHLKGYGVQKRDLLFTSDVDDATLGVLMQRISDKLNVWFPYNIVIEDLFVKSKTNKTVVLGIRFKYNDETEDVEVEIG